MSASGRQLRVETLKAKQPCALEDSCGVIEGITECRAGGLIVAHILPEALDVHIEFEAEH